MKTLVIAPAVHKTAGELVNDDDFPVLHDIVNVLLHDGVCLDCLVYVVRKLHILGVGQILDTESGFRLLDSACGERHALGALLNDIVRVHGLGLFLFIVRLFD